MQTLESVCFQRPSNRVFSEALYKKRPRLVFSKTLKKTFLRVTVLRVQCFTCRVISTPCHSLLTSSLSSLLSVLARALERESFDVNARFSSFSFEVKL